MSMVSVAAVPVIVRKDVSVIVRVSVEESATTLAPAGTAMVSNELPPPPPPPVVTVHLPVELLSVNVPFETSSFGAKQLGEPSTSATSWTAGVTMPLSSAHKQGTNHRLSQIRNAKGRTG